MTLDQIRTMSDRELDRYIAEQILGHTVRSTMLGIAVWTNLAEDPGQEADKLPRYTNDLNEINDAVMAWCGEDRNKQEAFVKEMDYLTRYADSIIQWTYKEITAPARTRCEALVLAAAAICRMGGGALNAEYRVKALRMSRKSRIWLHCS